MKKAYCLVLSLLLVAVSSGFVVMETGCTASQLATSVAIIEQQLPVALTLAVNLASIADPALAPVFTLISTAVTTDQPGIAAAVAAWKANKSSGNFAALSAAVSTLAGKINAQVLAANGVANPQKDAIALTAIGGIALLINGWAASLSGGNVSATATAALHVIEGWPEGRRQIEETAAVYGVSAEDFLADGSGPIQTCRPGTNCDPDDQVRPVASEW